MTMISSHTLHLGNQLRTTATSPSQILTCPATMLHLLDFHTPSVKHLGLQVGILQYLTSPPMDH